MAQGDRTPFEQTVSSGVTDMALKDAEVRALKALDRVYKRADERGLYVEVHPSGSKLCA